MGKSVPAHVNAKMLVWARETAGMDHQTVAGRLQTTVDRVTEWENQESLPSMHQARELARLYRRPISFFYFDTPPADPPRPTDFRITVLDEEHAFPPAVRFAIRDSHDRRDAAMRLMRSLGRRPIPVRLNATLEGTTFTFCSARSSKMPASSHFKCQGSQMRLLRASRLLMRQCRQLL
jgi:transcriptional regulator with XRE-family HTH domain